jgi:hypothetical protein
MELFSQNTFLRIAWAYVCLLMICVLAIVLMPAFREVGHLKHGCYLTDALVPYVECRGFLASAAVKFVLNLPFSLLFAPMFGFYAAVHFHVGAFVLLGESIALWLPIAYLIWHGFRRRAT